MEEISPFGAYRYYAWRTRPTDASRVPYICSLNAIANALSSTGAHKYKFQS